MAEIRFMEMSHADLEKNLNTVIGLLAVEMAKDGIVGDPSDITDRYLALVVEKSKAAVMFQSLFGKEDKDHICRFIVVRVDKERQ